MSDHEVTGGDLDRFRDATADLDDDTLEVWRTESWHQYLEVRQEQYRREHKLPPPKDLTYLDDGDLADRAGQVRLVWMLAGMELWRRERLLEQLDPDSPSG